MVRSADLANVPRREPLRALSDLERHLITVREGLEAVALDRGVVDEYILAPVLRDEAEALRLVEPLHGASAHWIPFFFQNPSRFWSDAVQRDGCAPADTTGFGSEDARP